MAELEEDPQLREEWLTFVVVGGGPTGVEISGQIAELSRRALKHNYKRFDPAVDVKVLLFDGGVEILASFGDRLSGKATQELERTGVEINCNSVVTHVDADGVVVKGPDGAERRVATKTVIWAAGVAGIATRADARRCIGRRVRPGRPRQRAPRLLAAGTPGGVRGRRHDGARRTPGRCRGRDAVGDPRGTDDQEAGGERCRLQALRLPRPRQHGRRLAPPRDRQLPRHSRCGLSRLADVARRSPHVHDRLQEPLYRSLPVGVRFVGPAEPNGPPPSSRSSLAARWPGSGEVPATWSRTPRATRPLRSCSRPRAGRSWRPRHRRRRGSPTPGSVGREPPERRPTPEALRGVTPSGQDLGR